MHMGAIDIVRNGLRSQIRLLAGRLNDWTAGRLTPTAVTVVGVAMHVPIAILVGLGQLIWAAVLLIIFGLFDVLDGELARLQNRATVQGMLYDATTDRIKEVVIFAGVAYWLSVHNYAHWTFMAVIACGASITVSYAKAKGEMALSLKHKISDHHTLNRHFKEGLAPFEIRVTIMVLGLLFNQLLLATVLVAVLASLTVFERLWVIGREVQ